MNDYPRPQFKRKDWLSLDGRWQFATSEVTNPAHVTWTDEIHVPYPPEASLSGIGNTEYHPVVWYQHTFTVPQDWQKRRIILNFGAADYRSRVWVNEQLVVTHEGGHIPFQADITDALHEGEQVITVRVEDDPHDMHKPRGKQDWLLEPHSIWYPRTSGIWQSVWLEPVHEQHIARVRFTPDLAKFAITTEVQLAGEINGSLKLEVKLGDGTLVSDTWLVTEKILKRDLYLPDPGIDDARRRYLWSPEQPTLLEVRLSLEGEEGVLDEVQSYTALRSVEARDGKFHLNGRPYFLRMVLDQGYWDESLLAAPSADALKKDVELAKAMGFNGVRKHQKIEDPRYLYWADTLGLLVWEELPSAYSFSSETVSRLTREWLAVIERDYNHPCIVAWVAFNESWGVPDLPQSAVQRHAVAALYHLTKSLDPSRPVIGNDGWEHVVTDLLTIHDYSRDPDTLADRYSTPEASLQTSLQTLEHGRTTLIDRAEQRGQPIILSEFGGIRFHPDADGWGYQQVDNAEALLELYTAMIAAISGRGLAGFCYTQFSDTFQEQNGLLYSDRRPKMSLESLAKATRGGR